MTFSWKRRESELHNEVAHHLHHLAAEYERQGYSREEALRLANREFGGITQVQERCRDERRWVWTTGLRQDIVFGWRMMRRTPVITAAAVISLALGIGANTAIVSLMDRVLWRDLPLPNPRQLTLVHWKGHGYPQELADGASGSMSPAGAWDVADFFSYPAFAQMRKSVSALASVAAFTYPDQVSVSFAGRPTVARERAVSGNFFSSLEVRPQFGRLLSDHDDTYAAPAVAVVSHRFWTRALSSDPNAAGRSIAINNETYLIAGVLEPAFYGLAPGDAAEIYTPLHHASFLHARSGEMQNALENNRYWGMQLVARRATGITESRLEPAMDAAFRATWEKPPTNLAAAPRISLDAGRRGLGILRDDLREPLLVLGGLVTLLLVIACVNIANLLLARANARQKELAMRISLGCGRARLMRQLFTESALLAILGGIAGIGIAWVVATLLGQFVAGHETIAIGFALDWRMMAMISSVAAAALLAFGLFPAWQASRRLDAGPLKHGAGSIGALSRRGWNSGRWFVTFQMALSVILVMTAVIFTRNLAGIQSSDPGFDRRNLILFGTRPGTSGYDKPRLAQFYFRLDQRLRATPGVSAVGLASVRPMDMGGWWEAVQIPGQAKRYDASVNAVTPAYLPLYTSRMIAGRNFDRADLTAPARVAIISEDLARRMGGNGVLGQRLEIVDGRPGAKRPEYDIVGIAPAIAVTSIKERPSALWLPFTGDAPEATVVLRTSQPPQAVLPAIRQAVSDVDRNLPMVDTITMEEQISNGLQRERMFATLCSGFGILALALSVVGLYGVISYSTSRRRGEIGLRLALGAQPRNVVSLILREGLGMAVLGILLGVPFLWLGGKYLQKELTNMKPLDPLSLILALGILLLAALFAAGLPALRASTLDPAETLRQE
jgi:predicted permease